MIQIKALALGRSYMPSWRVHFAQRPSAPSKLLPAAENYVF
jgi:hypothetical protein